MLTPKQLKELRRAPGAPNRLKAAMALVEETQVQLEQAVGIPQSQISKIKNGKYSRLPYETVRILSVHFGCAPDDLFPAVEDARASA